MPIDAMCEIWQELASWLQRRCRLKIFTTDGRLRWMDGPMTTMGGRQDACLYYKLTYEPLVQVSYKSFDEKSGNLPKTVTMDVAYD